jgi:hypothetical protein
VGGGFIEKKERKERENESKRQRDKSTKEE